MNSSVSVPESVNKNNSLESHPLRSFFAPKAVALIGATEKENSVGRDIMENFMIPEFQGKIYPVNPKRDTVLGIKAYPNVKDIPDQVDLVVICVPAKFVPGVMTDCVAAKVKTAIIISAGFKEIGAEGIALEEAVLEEARKGGIRIIGPNCLGVMTPITGTNASFARTMAHKGNVGFISQSGALGTSALDWCYQENVGFSSFISVGSMLDVDWGDLISYFGEDPDTNSIVIYMESIGNAKSFISAAREVALKKPIIVIKAGRSEAASKAAASHTGSMTGSDEVLDAVFKRLGVIRVDEIADVFYLSQVLAKQPRPKGPKLCILTNAGGPGVLAVDSLTIDGGELSELEPKIVEKFNSFLPEHWSHANPIDILGDAPPERYAESLKVAAENKDSDGMLVILTPQSMTNPTETATKLLKYKSIEGKPVLASWMGGSQVNEGKKLLNKEGIPTFDYPDTATKIFNYMWKYSDNLKSLYETPSLCEELGEKETDRKTSQEIIEAVKEDNRTILTEDESKRLLAAYGIPVTRTEMADTAEKAVALAQDMGFPVVVKIYSKTITHKTDVGGVKLNLKDAAAVTQAFNEIKNSVTEKAGAEHFNGVTVQPMVKMDGYELILGSSLDSQFGPVLLFGMGGSLVEVFKDSSLALPPLTSTLARRMMEKTKIYKALKGVRGKKSVDMQALETMMVKFSQLVAEQKWIKEIDINPLIISEDNMLALDARVVIHEKGTPEDQLSITAIRPYPNQYSSPWIMKDGVRVQVRPIKPEDEPLMVDFHQKLSEKSVYLHYAQDMSLSKRIEHERLSQICFNDFDRRIALVMIKENEDGKKEIISYGRLSKITGTEQGCFVVLVSDQYQGKGIGKELMSRIIQIAKDEKLKEVSANILKENTSMQELCKKIGFELSDTDSQNSVKASLKL